MSLRTCRQLLHSAIATNLETFAQKCGTPRTSRMAGIYSELSPGTMRQTGVPWYAKPSDGGKHTCTGGDMSEHEEWHVHVGHSVGLWRTTRLGAKTQTWPSVLVLSFSGTKIALWRRSKWRDDLQRSFASTFTTFLCSLWKCIFKHNRSRYSWEWQSETRWENIVFVRAGLVPTSGRPSSDTGKYS